MGTSIAGLQNLAGDMGNKLLSGGGSTLGKMIGSVAGILLLMAVLKATFYIVKTGERCVLLRNGQPVVRRNGMYKVRGPGIGIKIPGYHGIEKVNIQEQSQRLPDIIAECQNGQLKLEVDVVFKYLCEEDNLKYLDAPAWTIVKTKEPAQVFISRTGRAVRLAVESCTSIERNDSSLLLRRVNDVVGKQLKRRGLKLLEINIISCSRTAIQVAADTFGPKPESTESYLEYEQGDNIRELPLPHPIVMTTALDGVAQNS